MLNKDAEKYLDENYEDCNHWISYYYQYDLIRSTRSRSILDVGVGTGFLSAILKQKGYKVQTLDINEKLRPSVVGSVTAIPFPAESFDVVSAFQVLEHIDFIDFEKSVSEMVRVSRKYVVVSLPFFCLYLGFGILPFRTKYLNWIYKLFGRNSSNLDILGWHIMVPLGFMNNFGMIKDHKWELGRNGYPKSKVEKVFRDKGLLILKAFHRPMYPYHLFYLLEKGTI